MSAAEETHEYEVVVVGGGSAGMTAMLYSTRLGHKTAVVTRGGRAAMMKEVHNLIGIKEETSGMEFLGVGNEQLEDYGCEINDDGTIAVGDHGKTSVEDVYAVGDCTPGHNQIPVALGQGAKAGINLHFRLSDFPRYPDLLNEQGEVRDDEIPGIHDELLEQAVDFHTYGE